MKKLSYLSITTLLMTVVFVACKKEIPTLIIPSTYESANYTSNVATETTILNNLSNITTEAKKGRKTGAKVSMDSLLFWFNNGNPSLNSSNTAYYNGKLVSEYFTEIAKASGNTYTPSETISGEGGTFGGYLFDENGLEMEQMIEKGQFGSVLYNHANSLLSGNLTIETVDKVIAIFGANPTFPNTPTASKTAKPDKFMANYAARRDKNDGKGYYSQMKNAFLKLQAAIKGGSDYNKEREEAIAEILLTWEKVNASTIINYCHSVIATMSKTSTTDAEKGASLHAYGECVGFIAGWKNVNNKRISDSQIDEVLALLNAPSNTKPTSYQFITDPINQLPKLTQVIAKLKSIYGFSDAEIEDFKSNWVSVQGR